MPRNLFGWSLPPGCTQRHIDEAFGESEDDAPPPASHEETPTMPFEPEIITVNLPPRRDMLYYPHAVALARARAMGPSARLYGCEATGYAVIVTENPVEWEGA